MITNVKQLRAVLRAVGEHQKTADLEWDCGSIPVKAERPLC